MLDAGQRGTNFAPFLSRLTSTKSSGLINSQRFNLAPHCKRFFDFTQTQDGHPRILSNIDLPILAQSLLSPITIPNDSKAKGLRDQRINKVPG
jgi:hypothetical protein